MKKSRGRTVQTFLITTLLVVAVVFVLSASLRERVSFFVWESTRSHALSFFLNPNDADLYVAKGEYYLNNKEGSYDLSSAQEMFVRAKTLDEKSVVATYNLARTYFLQGNLDQAEVYLQETLTLDSENKRPHYILGLVHTYGENFEAAAKDFQKFIEYAPDEWAGYNDLAWVYLQDGKYREAEDISRDGLRAVDENNIWLLTNLGAAQLQLGEHKEALSTFLKVESLFYDVPDPVWQEAYPGNDPIQVNIIKTEFEGLIFFNKAQAYEQLGGVESYKEAITKAREIIPYYSTFRPLVEEEG